jgi:hypothetical protein
MTSSQITDTCLYLASRFSLAQECSSLNIYGSFAFRYTLSQSGPLLMIECCISVFNWNSVSIAGDRLVIEVHDNV